MNTATVGMMYGIALGFAAAFGGFSAFVMVAALGAAGYGVGRLAEGGGLAEALRSRDWDRDRDRDR
ncbi:hypothetical protein KGQ20_07705 [Catenulispora sp. NF23]|uniref:DUF2273 domain-containing protein n=1 Tax=Catenulispora pinistramenti TaxID=2705254 RepID=A0ABS5KNF7_9ACTN|nr:hypothetical protein [Catenulispora pinistramenti]MBS2532656.1 hypothetical protein [Catenulispora pinistramenti]MBS2547587.1 hypothetical protein [Catenulispora pinistramenti]